MASATNSSSNARKPAVDAKPPRSSSVSLTGSSMSASAGVSPALGLPPAAPVRFPEGGTEVVVKRNQSKYDFVKVRVWVGDHFYVLSRYLVCRALVSTKINSKDAVQISLDLKRTLVDLGLTDIVQEQFEDFLYKTMLVFGYGEAHISCYRMMSSFHRNRVPLLIILAGTSCTGKSTLATKLADRLNLSSVLQTDLIFELMCNFSGREETLYYSDEFASTDELLREYANDCAVVRKGVTSDIDKCLKEGKSLIVEGFHIDPRLYQREVAVQASPGASSGTSGFSGIVVPFLLTLDESSHWSFMTNSPDPRYRTDAAQRFGFPNLQRVQEYLRAHASEPGMAPFMEIPINIHSFHETLDLLHDIVLQRIEEEYVLNHSSSSAGASQPSPSKSSPAKRESTGA